MANETYGAIKLSDANAVGSMLVKKMGGSGYAPSEWAEQINLMGKLPEKTVSGSIASFPDGADDVPVKSAKFYFLPSGGGGTPSAPVAITGVSGLSVTRTGKNLLDMTVYDGGSYNPAVGTTITLSVSASQFTKTGNAYTIDTTTSWKTFTVRMPVKSGVTYYRKFTMSASGTNLGSSEYYLDADNKVIGSVSNNTDNPHTKTGTLSVPSGAVWFVITFTNRSTSTNTLTITEPQLEVGSTATTYEAYSTPTTYPVSWSEHGTIYGGYADIVTGEGKEIIGMIRLDTLPFTKNGTQNNPNGTYFSLDGVTVPFVGWGSGGRDSASCTELAKASAGAGGQTEPNNTFWWNNASTGWRVVWGLPYGGSSLDDFTRFLTNRDVVVVGKLTTPNDFSFQPVSPVPSTYLGSNNFFSDANGDSEVTYRRDIDLALSASATRSAPVSTQETQESEER